MALHEAAHAVVAHRLGYRVHSATCIPSGTGQGYAEYDGRIADLGGVAVSLAGHECEVMFGIRARDAGARTDYADARRELLEYTGPLTADEELVAMAEARALARELVLEHKQAIYRVAWLLVMGGTLEGDALRVAL